jgi:hypothetical protein
VMENAGAAEIGAFEVAARTMLDGVDMFKFPFFVLD